MPTLNVILKTHRVKKDGRVPVVFQLIIERKPSYHFSGYAVMPSQFRAGLSGWITKHPDQALMNRNLEIRRSEVMRNLMDAEAGKFPMDPKAIFSGNSETGMTIDGLLAERALIYEKRESPCVNHLIVLRGQVKAFFGPAKPVSSITVPMVEGFVSYLKSAGNNPNTIVKKIKTLRCLVAGKILSGDYQGKNAFALVRPAGVPIHKTKLTWPEIQQIERLKLAGLIGVIRSLFLFSFYAQGMRFENCVLLRKSDIGENSITYRMNKGRKTREVSLNPRLRAIISTFSDTAGPYLFPLVKPGDPITGSSWRHRKDGINIVANTYLKRIAILAGIEKKVSMHIARHTFAYLLKVHQSETGKADIYVIQQALGHSDVKTTEMYLAALDDDKVNAAVSGMWR